MLNTQRNLQAKATATRAVAALRNGGNWRSPCGFIVVSNGLLSLRPQGNKPSVSYALATVCNYIGNKPSKPYIVRHNTGNTATALGVAICNPTRNGIGC